MRAVASWCVVSALVTTCACSRPQAEEATAATAGTPRPAADGPSVGTSDTTAAHVSVDFQNVDFRVAPGVVMQVSRLQGALLATRRGSPPSFDDLGSYALQIEAGEIAMTPASLTALLNTRVFAYRGAPISNLEITIEDGRLKQKGTLHKGLDVPFTIIAEVSATRDGRIRLHPQSVKTIGIPAGGLMKLFGLELDDLIASNQARGFEIVGDDFLLTPDRLLSQPRVTGHLTAIRVEANRIVEIFGSRRAAGGDGVAKNYMYYKGGDLRFGKLTMHDTDLRLVDADPRDPFDFAPAQYATQLAAGYSKSLVNGGLRTFIPDLGEPMPR
jgi:hypothetical protein